MFVTTSLFRLALNRIIEYAEYGDRNGIPVVFFHSLFGSHHQAALIHKTAQRYGVRIIAPNRYGVGKTSMHVYASPLEYAEDIRQLVDYLNIQKFAIISVSAGSGFALATGYAMPERVRFIVAAGLLPPLEMPEVFKSMYWLRRWVLWLARCCPWPIAGFMATMQWGVKYFSFIFKPFLAYILLPWSTDSQLVAEKIFIDIQKRSTEELFIKGNAAGHLLQELNHYYRWGFPLESYLVPVAMWHGSKDKVATLEVIQRIQQMNPQQFSIVYYNGGHFDLALQVEHICQYFVKKWEFSSPKYAQRK